MLLYGKFTSSQSFSLKKEDKEQMKVQLWAMKVIEATKGLLHQYIDFIFVFLKFSLNKN